MSSSRGVPDAWDDDWVDKPSNSFEHSSQSSQSKKSSKAEKRRQQLEFNKKLWEEAEAPGLPYLLQRKNDVPLQSGFIPTVKVLSRKPAIGPTTRQTPSSSSNNGNLEADHNDEEQDEVGGKQVTAEEREEKSRRELEERQRRYEEVRQKIFGSETNSTDQALQPNMNAQRPRYFNSSEPARGERSRQRGRGSPALRGSFTRQLYDPNTTRGNKTSGVRREDLTSDGLAQRNLTTNISRRSDGLDVTSERQNASS